VPQARGVYGLRRPVEYPTVTDAVIETLLPLKKPSFMTSDKAVYVNQTGLAQFLTVCSRSKWSRHLTKSPFLALLAMAGSNAAYKIISACSNAVS
jgi:hypothetical protein